MAGSSPSFRPHSGWTCAVAGKLLSTLLLVSGLAGIAVWKLGPTFAEHDGLHHVASSQVNLRHRRLRQCENSWERQLAHILRVNPNEDCSDDDCELTPFCYDPLLNVGPQLACCDGNVRVFSNEILVEDEDSSLFEELEAQGLGLAVDSTGKYQVRLIIAERPSCNSVNLLTDTHEGATYYEYIEHLKQRLQHHQLSCNLNHWELIQVSENNTVCRSQANDFLHSPLNERYNDVELTTIAFDESTGGWTSGWAQGWCPPFAAVEGKCDVNLPFASRLQGNSGNGSNTGFKPDGGLAIDFDSGLNGEFGARQVHSEPNYDDHIAFFRKGGLKDEWLNDLAIVEDGEHPEEGHVARLAAFIRNNGTQEEPEWVPAHHGGLTTTRLFGSGRYEVRAKVPLAEGFAWGMWTEYSSGPIYADRPKPSSCSSFEGLQAGDMESCASCAEHLPESGSPFWLKKEKGSVNAQEIDNMCPPAAADVRKSSPHPDGLIDTLEGVPFYGGIQVSLTTEGDTSPDSALALDRFPVANDDGTLWYHRSIQVSENVADHIDMLHYVIHGIDLDGSNGYNGVTGPLGAPLEATVPAGCGGTSEGIPVHVLRADLDAVPHNEEADGGSDVTGHARIIVHGTTVRVYVEASGLSPDLPHAMHIHGAVSDGGDGEESDNDGSMCPPATADVRGLNGTDSPPDGFIDVLEGVPFYGGILASLTTEGDTSPDSALALDRFPVADGDGHLTYYRVFEVSEDVSAGLAQLHIVIHGLDLDDDGEYDGEAGSLGAPLEATLPVTCGELEVVSMDGTMYELMVGAVPHAEDADGGSNVEGHGYVVVANAVLYVDMYVEGVTAGVPHAQHFHGSMMAGARNMCPPAAADVRGLNCGSDLTDGLIDTLEGVPFYGGIQVSLTTEGDTSPDSALALDRFPVANDDGTLWYHRSIQVSENVADHIDMLHYVIHGIDLDGSNGYNGVTGPLGAPLEATVPAGCGGTSEGIPVHVLRADLDAVPHNEEADGGSDVTGHARIIVHGTTVRVYVEASGLSPDLPHAMHIHGAVSDGGDGEESDNDGSMCPPATADVRGLNGTDSPPDGFIDVLEGVPFYGGILASLTTEGDTSPDSALALDRFPVADGDGHLTYYRVFEVSEDVSAGLAQLHIVIHGLDLDDDGEYDGEAGSLGAPLEATLPVTCGELEVVSMDGTMYELMVGAVPHAEDADGGSNVEGHGYVVVADAVLYVDMYVEGVTAGVPHAQHFHGSMMAGARNMCPPAAADVRKSSPHPDGLIDTLEGVPFYGGIQVSLTTEGDTSPDSALALDRFPVANDDGTLWYHRSIQVSENVADHIDMLHYVIHGIDLDGSNGYNGVTGPLGAPLEATVPAGCGGTSEGIPVHVLRADLDAVPHNEEADGGSDVTGHARIIVHGTTVRVYVEASGLSPDLPHAMHIHGAVSDGGDGEESDNDGSMCPPATADVRGLNGTDSPPDGFIDVLEGVPFYGGILASLTTEGDTSPDSALALDRFPVADRDGHLTYYRVFEVSEDVSAGLAQLHIVIHGLDLDDDGEYDGEAGSLGAPLEATLPVTCGELEVVSMDGTMYELMVGAVPHAEDADGGSNVEGHGYVVVANAVLYVDMYVEGVAAGVPHAQHFHGSMMAGARNMCPPAAADVRGLNCGSDLTDGLIDTLEGVPFYGGIQVSLTTEGDTSPDSALALDRFPVANDDGTLWYHRSIQVSENVADHIDMLHYVIHGIDLDGSNGYNGVTGPLGAPLEATVPAGCGGTSEGIPVHVLRADLDAVPHNEEADGGSDVTGHARIIVHGTTVRVYVEASGLSPDLPHAMHIHGAVSDDGDGEESDNDGSMCPPATADVRGLNGTDSPPDGFIDVLEGVPFYGGILASLTTEGDTSPDSALALDRFPVADGDGHLTYYRVFEVSEDVSAGLAKLHIVIHGLDLDDDGEYDGEAGSLGAPLEATLPVTCGELEVVSMDGTMYELMVGAVPHAEDADGGSNVEGHGYVVVADAVLYVDMYVEGVAAGVPHAQHFHGKLPEQADSFIPAGFYTPTAGTEYLQSEVNFLFPGHMGTLDNSNIASIINRRWSSPDHDGTQSHFLIVGNESFIGDGAYHDYAFEWHTGGHTSNGYQEPRVDYYIDGVYTGSNTIAVPSVVGRFNLMLFPADWNGDLAPEQAEGDAQSSLHTYLLYATAYVSKVSITPFYESNDAVLPAAYDQPDLNRRAVCGEDVFIPCGTNPIVPFTTPNHYISPEDGGPVTPCCGAVCMSTEEEECPTGVNSVYVVGNRPAQDCRCTHSGPDEFGDPTFSGEEFDATCLWHPTKPRDFEPSECTRRDYPMQLDYYRGRGPWDINLGCRYDINRVCVDANLNEEEMVQSCYDWLDENCGQLFNRTYWEAWVERPSLRCRLYIRPPYHENNIDYTVYPGVTPSNIGEVLLPEADYFQGCRFNFLKNPPIYIPSNTSEEASSEGEGNPQTSGDQESANDPSRRQLDHLDRPQFDPTGCSWALDYCPGATIEMFNVAVSRRTDINGNRVCEIQRKDEFTPSRPRDLEYPGTRGTCDVDYEEFMPWCESDDDCEDWTGDHCDVPAALSVKCSEAHFCHISFNNSVAPEVPPVPLCYPMDEEKYSEPYRGCSRNYNTRPPCGDTVSDCKEFVESHCDDPSVYVITLAEELDRNGNARCIIQREHDFAVGSPDQACEASECFSCQRDGCNSSEPAFPSPSPIAVTPPPLPSPSPAPMEAESSVFRVAAEGFGSLSSTEFEDHIVDWIDLYSDDNDLNVVVAAIATRVNLAGDLLVFDANVTVIGASLDLEQLAQNLDALAENLLQYLNNEVFVLEFICSNRVSPRRIAEGA